MIPCKECVCLAICKSKLELECSIMFKYLDELEEKDNVKWSLIEQMFNEKGDKIMHIIEKDNPDKFILVKSPHPHKDEKNFIMMKDGPEGITRVFCRDVGHLKAALECWKHGQLYDFLIDEKAQR